MSIEERRRRNNIAVKQHNFRKKVEQRALERLMDDPEIQEELAQMPRYKPGSMAHERERIESSVIEMAEWVSQNIPLNKKPEKEVNSDFNPEFNK